MLRPAQSSGTLWDELEPALQARFESLMADGDPQVERAWKRSVVRPLEMFLRRPSKELRANLTAWGWSLGKSDHPPELLPLLVELIHAGSLIMDDVQDDAERRRGGKALHRAIGIPLALSAAASLYFLPFEFLAKMGLPQHVELRLHRRMVEAMLACCHGQSLDLATLIEDVPPASLRAFVETATAWKTGRLMGFAAELGAIAGEVETRKADAASALGNSIGVALQMLNDLSDLAPRDGPQRGYEDLAGRRPTWCWVWAYEVLDAPEYSQVLRTLTTMSDDRTAISSFAETLRASILLHARFEIDRVLNTALDAWSSQFGLDAELTTIMEEVRRLEGAYAR
jgi:geranylgeranyl pyrophosphate synthase